MIGGGLRFACINALGNEVRLLRFFCLVSFNDELVANFRAALEYCMSRQFNHALRSKVRARYLERSNQFAQSNHLEIFVDEHYIEFKEHPDGVDGIGRNDPNSAVRPERTPAQQS